MTTIPTVRLVATTHSLVLLRSFGKQQHHQMRNHSTTTTMSRRLYSQLFSTAPTSFVSVWSKRIVSPIISMKPFPFLPLQPKATTTSTTITIVAAMLVVTTTIIGMNNNNTTTVIPGKIVEYDTATGIQDNAGTVVHCESSCNTIPTNDKSIVYKHKPKYTILDDKSSITRTATNDTSKLIFLGTGSSTGCPRPICSLLFGNHHNSTNQGIGSTTTSAGNKQQYEPFCRTSIVATADNPRYNKNYRNNPSMIISLGSDNVNENSTTNNNNPTKNIIIDTGKTFREATIRWLPLYNITSIDAIVLTHEHMDACGGLDDVRGYQKWIFETTNTESKTKPTAVVRPKNAVPMPLFVSQQCYNQIQKQFPWLFPKATKQTESEDKTTTLNACTCTSADTTNNSTSPTSTTVPVVKRHVASFDVTILKPYESIEVIKQESSTTNTETPVNSSSSHTTTAPTNFTMIPLPVMHGEDFVSYGYAFTVHRTNVLYLSDVSRMLPETIEYIEQQLPITDLLIVDALNFVETNSTHYNLTDAVQLGKQIQSINEMKKTIANNSSSSRTDDADFKVLLVGMNCDDFPLHDQMNEYLQRTYNSNNRENRRTNDRLLDIRLAHDGLVIDIHP